MNIAWKELFAIFVAVHTLGIHWAKQKYSFIVTTMTFGERALPQVLI